jgi:CubicO group peptidase (beta-lactamase class C family)
MSAGLADLDPYYDLDLRAVALRQTRVVEPPGRRFRYNNVNPVLLGMVLERTTGEPVSTYLAEQLWGPLGMEADGSWSLDSRRSGLELLQAGLNGRAVDFAFWAQGNHGQFIYVAPSRNLVLVRFGINYDYDHWPELLAALARRL